MLFLFRILPAMACLFLLAPAIFFPAETAQAQKMTSAKTRAAKKPPVVFFDYSVVDGHNELLILADGPIKKYKTFGLENPPRLVLDISDVTIIEKVVGLPINRPELSKIRIARHPEKVRFVFDLTAEESTHKVLKIDKGLKVILTAKNPPPAPPPKLPLTSEEPQQTAPPEERNQSAGSQAGIAALFGNQRVTILFHKAPPKEFFAFVAEKSKMRIEVSPEVIEPISLRLTDVPLSEAVSAVVNHLNLVLIQGKSQITVRNSQGKKESNGRL